MSLRVKAYYRQLGFKGKADYSVLGLLKKSNFFRGTLQHERLNSFADSEDALWEIYFIAENKHPIEKNAAIEDIPFLTKNILFASMRQKNNRHETLIQCGRLFASIEPVESVSIWMKNDTLFELVYSRGNSLQISHKLRFWNAFDFLQDHPHTQTVFLKSNDDEGFEDLQHLFQVQPSAIPSSIMMTPLYLRNDYLGLILSRIRSIINPEKENVFYQQMDTASLILSQCLYIDQECVRQKEAISENR